MIGRTVTAVSAVIIALLVGGATYLAIGGPTANVAIARVAIDDLVVRWPHHDAAVETGIARLESDDAFAVAVAATDDGVIEHLGSHLPDNQTIFDVKVEASSDTNAIHAADAVAEWLVTDSLERRQGPREENGAGDDDLALIESQFLVVGRATTDEPSNARTATALAAGLSAGLLIVAASEFVNARRKRTDSDTNDG
jgi:hypothetical protein